MESILTVLAIKYGVPVAISVLTIGTAYATGYFHKYIKVKKENVKQQVSI